MHRLEETSLTSIMLNEKRKKRKLMKTFKLAIASLICLLFFGCKNSQNQDEDYSPSVWTNSILPATSSMVCVGVENGYAGECIGASLDAASMF